MDFNQYQFLSKRTIPVHQDKTERDYALANYALGLVSESGEVGDNIKKHIFHSHEISLEEVKGELGDVLHYLAGLATILGIELEDVATANIEKLRKRYPNGFSVEDSIKRVDVDG